MNDEQVLRGDTAMREGASAGLDLAPAGRLLALVSLLAALEAFGLFRRNLLFLWPGLLLAAGLAQAGLTFWSARSRRPQAVPPRRALQHHDLRPHWVLAGLALAGGLGEVVRAAGQAGTVAGLASFLWPAALLVLGYLVMVPAVAGGAVAAAECRPAVRLGATLLLAGLMRAFEALFGVQPGAVGTGWFVALLVAAIQMLRYRPPRAP